jgi:propanediol dehydratase large subunit
MPIIIKEDLSSFEGCFLTVKALFVEMQKKLSAVNTADQMAAGPGSDWGLGEERRE